MTTAEMQQQFATNFYGVVHLMHAVLPVMRQQRSGQIINISSVAGVVGLKHCAAYGASKFAVEGLSLSVATEVAQKPWIVPIPGTTKLNRLEENIGAVEIELTADDLREFDRAASQIDVQGARYPEELERRTGL